MEIGVFDLLKKFFGLARATHTHTQHISQPRFSSQEKNMSTATPQNQIKAFIYHGSEINTGEVVLSGVSQHGQSVILKIAQPSIIWYFVPQNQAPFRSENDAKLEFDKLNTSINNFISTKSMQYKVHPFVEKKYLYSPMPHLKHPMTNQYLYPDKNDETQYVYPFLKKIYLEEDEKTFRTVRMIPVSITCYALYKPNSYNLHNLLQNIRKRHYDGASSTSSSLAQKIPTTAASAGENRPQKQFRSMNRENLPSLFVDIIPNFESNLESLLINGGIHCGFWVLCDPKKIVSDSYRQSKHIYNTIQTIEDLKIINGGNDYQIQIRNYPSIVEIKKNNVSVFNVVDNNVEEKKKPEEETKPEQEFNQIIEIKKEEGVNMEQELNKEEKKKENKVNGKKKVNKVNKEEKKKEKEENQIIKLIMKLSRMAVLIDYHSIDSSKYDKPILNKKIYTSQMANELNAAANYTLAQTNTKKRKHVSSSSSSGGENIFYVDSKTILKTSMISFSFYNVKNNTFTNEILVNIEHNDVDSTEIETRVHQMKNIYGDTKNFERGNAKAVINSDIKIFKEEKDLLSYFVKFMSTHDPDILITHNVSTNNHWIILEERIRKLLDQHKGIRRIKEETSVHSLIQNGIGGGRIFIDLHNCIHQHESINLQTNPSIFEVLANHKSLDFDHDYHEPLSCDIKTIFQTIEDIDHIFVTKIHQMILLHLSVEKLNILQLEIQKSLVSGSFLTHSIERNWSYNNANSLLHLFHGHNYTIPLGDVNSKNVKLLPATEEKLENPYCQVLENETKIKATGGHNFEPIIGLTSSEFQVTVDIRNSYPSAVQQYKICLSNMCQYQDIAFLNYIPETISKKNYQDIEQMLIERMQIQLKTEETNKHKPIDKLKQEEIKSLPIFAHHLHLLQTKRLEYKNLSETLKDYELRQYYDIKQKAYKIHLNSLLGCFGQPVFRFYNPLIYKLITTLARVALENGKKKLELTKYQKDSEDISYQTSYGDTDSLKFNIQMKLFQNAKKWAKHIESLFNSKYPFVQWKVEDYNIAEMIIQKKNFISISVNHDSIFETDMNHKLTSESNFLPIDNKYKSMLPQCFFIFKSCLWEKSNSCLFTNQLCRFISIKLLYFNDKDKFMKMMTSFYFHALKVGIDLIKSKTWNYFTIRNTVKEPQYNTASGLAFLEAIKQMKAINKPFHRYDTIAYIMCYDRRYRNKVMPMILDHVQRAAGSIRPDLAWYLEKQIFSWLKNVEDIATKHHFGDKKSVLLKNREDLNSCKEQILKISREWQQKKSLV
jgi:DNA polymerase elongation subunit (family B)